MIGPRAPFSPVLHDPPVEQLDDEFPLRLTTGRRLDAFNTGVQSDSYSSPLRQRETLDISPEDGKTYGLEEFERVRVSSRRGALVIPVRFDAGLRPGLAFMTPHSPDHADANVLTIDAIDPKSGTAEFKACAVRIDKMRAAPSGD